MSHGNLWSHTFIDHRRITLEGCPFFQLSQQRLLVSSTQASALGPLIPRFRNERVTPGTARTLNAGPQAPSTSTVCAAFFGWAPAPIYLLCLPSVASPPFAFPGSSSSWYTPRFLLHRHLHLWLSSSQLRCFTSLEHESPLPATQESYGRRDGHQADKN